MSSRNLRGRGPGVWLAAAFLLFVAAGCSTGDSDEAQSAFEGGQTTAELPQGHPPVESAGSAASGELGGSGVVAGLTWSVPDTWRRGAERPMRAATYEIGPTAGDPEPAECAVYYFGKEQGGGVQDNVDGWIGQFEQPDGGPSKEIAITDTREIAQMKVTTVEVPGTYTGSMGPMSGGGVAKENFRMLAAIVEGPEGAVFFKLTGPEATVTASRSAFDRLISSIMRAGG